MLAMWLFFWTEGDWVPATPEEFWCALTSSSGFTGGGTIEELG
jgi:hypothetical protein